MTPIILGTLLIVFIVLIGFLPMSNSFWEANRAWLPIAFGMGIGCGIVSILAGVMW